MIKQDMIGQPLDLRDTVAFAKGGHGTVLYTGRVVDFHKKTMKVEWIDKLGNIKHTYREPMGVLKVNR